MLRRLQMTFLFILLPQLKYGVDQIAFCAMFCLIGFELSTDVAFRGQDRIETSDFGQIGRIGCNRFGSVVARYGRFLCYRVNSGLPFRDLCLCIAED